MAAVTATAASVLSASPSFAAPTGALELPPRAAITDLRVLADGRVGVAAGVGESRFWKTTASRLGDGGPSSTLNLRDRRSSYAAGAFSPQGDVLVMRQPRLTSSERSSVELRTYAADGRPTTNVTTWRAGKGQQISAATPLVGPTGAVVVLLNESTATGQRLALAFRAAGASAFGKPIRLRSNTRRQSMRGDDTGDGIDTTFKFAFAQDGAGALIALPESKAAGSPYVRRISAAGRLGPKIDLGLTQSSGTRGDLAFDDAGRLQLAIASWKSGSKTWGTNGRAYAGSLAPGSDATPLLQDLGKVTDGSENLVLHLAALRGDRSAVLLGAEFQEDLRLFEGAGTLREVPVPGVGWRSIDIHALPSGGLLFTWEEVDKQPGVYTSIRTPDGSLSAPKQLALDLEKGSIARLERLAVLADGRVGLAWTESSNFGATERTFASIVSP